MVTTLPNNIKLTLGKNEDFQQFFAWKDKYKEPIDISDFSFRSQFRYNFPTSEEKTNVLCTLTSDDGGGIELDIENGEIILNIPHTVTQELKNYDDGLWSLDYKSSDKSFYKQLISGRWVVSPEITENE